MEINIVGTEKIKLEDDLDAGKKFIAFVLNEEIKKSSPKGTGVSYTPAVKKAIDKYRQKNIEKYNEKQREYYSEAKQDEEWKKKFNERCKINNQKYRQKKKESLGEIKPRGRPRKEIKINIQNIAT